MQQRRGASSSSLKPAPKSSSASPTRKPQHPFDNWEGWDGIVVDDDPLTFLEQSGLDLQNLPRTMPTGGPKAPMTAGSVRKRANLMPFKLSRLSEHRPDRNAAKIIEAYSECMLQQMGEFRREVSSILHEETERFTQENSLTDLRAEILRFSDGMRSTMQELHRSDESSRREVESMVRASNDQTQKLMQLEQRVETKLMRVDENLQNLVNQSDSQMRKEFSRVSEGYKDLEALVRKNTRAFEELRHFVGVDDIVKSFNELERKIAKRTESQLAESQLVNHRLTAIERNLETMASTSSKDLVTHFSQMKESVTNLDNSVRSITKPFAQVHETLGADSLIKAIRTLEQECIDIKVRLAQSADAVDKIGEVKETMERIRRSSKHASNFLEDVEENFSADMFAKVADLKTSCSEAVANLGSLNASANSLNKLTEKARGIDLESFDTLKNRIDEFSRKMNDLLSDWRGLEEKKLINDIKSLKHQCGDCVTEFENVNLREAVNHFRRFANRTNELSTDVVDQEFQSLKSSAEDLRHKLRKFSNAWHTEGDDHFLRDFMELKKACTLAEEINQKSIRETMNKLTKFQDKASGDMEIVTAQTEKFKEFVNTHCEAVRKDKFWENLQKHLEEAVRERATTSIQDVVSRHDQSLEGMLREAKHAADKIPQLCENKLQDLVMKHDNSFQRLVKEAKEAGDQIPIICGRIDKEAKDISTSMTKMTTSADKALTDFTSKIDERLSGGIETVLSKLETGSRKAVDAFDRLPVDAQRALDSVTNGLGSVQGDIAKFTTDLKGLTSDFNGLQRMVGSAMTLIKYVAPACIISAVASLGGPLIAIVSSTT